MLWIITLKNHHIVLVQTLFIISEVIIIRSSYFYIFCINFSPNTIGVLSVPNHLEKLNLISLKQTPSTRIRIFWKPDILWVHSPKPLLFETAIKGGFFLNASNELILMKRQRETKYSNTLTSWRQVQAAESDLKLNLCIPSIHVDGWSIDYKTVSSFAWRRKIQARSSNGKLGRRKWTSGREQKGMGPHFLFPVSHLMNAVGFSISRRRKRLFYSLAEVPLFSVQYVLLFKAV